MVLSGNYFAGLHRPFSCQLLSWADDWRADHQPHETVGSRRVVLVGLWGFNEEAFSSGARTKQLESLVDDKEAGGWLHEWYYLSVAQRG